jgi:uncharacterized cupin superfamily protein
MSVDEARLQDGVPQTAGWFVVNARDARWLHNDMRAVCRFGGQGEAHFDHLGIGLYWVQPDRPMSYYHHEAGQEDFLVLRGECVLVIEGVERRLSAWDFVHCPPRTAHTIIAAGDEPALILAVGARIERGSARYPVEPLALKYAAGAASDDIPPERMYEAYGPPTPGPPPDIFPET